MARKKKEVTEKEAVEDTKLDEIKASQGNVIITDVCPTCGPKGDIINGKCRLCGARKTINSVSGNVIWMRNGRIVRAFRDSKQAYVKMALNYGIPKSEWPEEFK